MFEMGSGIDGEYVESDGLGYLVVSFDWLCDFEIMLVPSLNR